MTVDSPLVSLPTGPHAPAAPVADRQRIVTLDVVRGFALLGILMVNIQAFAFPFSRSIGGHWWESPPVDAGLRLIVDIVFTEKFITIFSLLFGMGLALMNDRPNCDGQSFGRLYSRRLAALLVIGILHGIFLWYGDILTMYALLGFAAMLFRSAMNRTLLRVGFVFLFVPAVLLFILAALNPSADWSESTTTAISEPKPGPTTSTDAQALIATSSAGARSEAGSDIGDRITRFLHDEQRIYSSGTWGEIALHRTCFYVLFYLYELPTHSGWRCLGLFLLGMYTIRTGLFDTNEFTRRRLRRMVVLGFPTGAVLTAAALWIQHHDPVHAAWVAPYVILFDFGSLGLALGYIGVLGQACRNPIWQGRLGWLAAAGRMAFTNYLLQSVVCSFVFYSFGLALFGRLSFAAVFGIAITLYAAQLFVSRLWLRVFRFGPGEWLWRSITYWRVQPFIRRAEALPAPFG